MSLKARLLIATILLVAISILVMGIFSISMTVRQANDALTQSAKDKLISQNVQTKDAVEDYLGFIESQLRTLSYSLLMTEAVTDLIPAFNDYATQRGEATAAEVERLTAYYNNDFTEQYNVLNPDNIISASDLLSGIDRNAVALQYDFIGGSAFPLGEKDKLEKPDNTSDYASLHQKYHPTMRYYLQEFGYYDIFIADITTGNIVYSVFKELDFGTSLRTGPYAKTGIGRAFDLAANASKQDQVFFTPFNNYLPSYNALAGFVSSPVYVNGKAVAVLIFQMPMDHLNSLLTHQQEWREKGFGDSGETYLVNDRGTLLTQSRFFLEDRANYLRIIGDRYPQQIDEIESRGTSIGIQPVDSIAAQKALKGESGFETIFDYRNVEVFSAYSPVMIGKQTMAVMAEIDVDEALEPAVELRNSLIQSVIIEMLVLVAIAAAVATLIANRIVRPLDRLGNACEELTQGEGDLTVSISPSSIPEINRITENFNIFIAQIREIIASVKTDADSLSAASQQLSSITLQSETVSALQHEQTAAAATAMTELSASINEVARSTVETRDKGLEAEVSLRENMQNADMAAKNIEHLVSLINESSEVISGLKNEVNQITTVLGVITSIADQTNLLALNAAIEAARAGEAGRGFSVVADEVRALATRSQQSTVEISNMVEVMNQSSKKSVERMENAAATADSGFHLIQQVTSAMAELNVTLRSVMELTEVIATAAVEQNATSDSVVENVNSINDMAHNMREGAAQTSQSAEELARIAANAQELVSRFKV